MAKKYLDNWELLLGWANKTEKVEEGLGDNPVGYITEYGDISGRYATFNDSEITIWSWHESQNDIQNGEYYPDFDILKIVGDFRYEKDGKATGHKRIYYDQFLSRLLSSIR